MPSRSGKCVVENEKFGEKSTQEIFNRLEFCDDAKNKFVISYQTSIAIVI